MKTNRDVYKWLVAGNTTRFPPAPPEVLADWVETIPYNVFKTRARRALKRRFGLDPAPRLPWRPRRSAKWLHAAFQPPVYSTDDATGERVLLSPDFVAKAGLLKTTPQKYYKVPEGLPPGELGKWLFGEQPYEDREAHASWFDCEGHEYEMINEQLVPSQNDGAD